MKKVLVIAVLSLTTASFVHAGEYLGQLSTNPYAPNSTSAPGANNYRSRQSMENQFSTGGPKLYDSEGNYRGNLNGNRFDPDSVSNPYGRYGSEYSSESLNNQYGAGSQYRLDSPNNRYGTGWSIYDE